MSMADRYFPSALNARLAEVGFVAVRPPGQEAGVNYWQRTRAEGDVIMVSVYKLERKKPADQKMVLSVSVTRGEVGKRLSCLTYDEMHASRAALLNTILDRAEVLETRLMRALDVAWEEEAS